LDRLISHPSKGIYDGIGESLGCKRFGIKASFVFAGLKLESLFIAKRKTLTLTAIIDIALQSGSRELLNKPSLFQIETRL
jgi:hypothetical protein